MLLTLGNLHDVIFAELHFTSPNSRDSHLRPLIHRADRACPLKRVFANLPLRPEIDGTAKLGRTIEADAGTAIWERWQDTLVQARESSLTTQSWLAEVYLEPLIERAQASAAVFAFMRHHPIAFTWGRSNL